MDSVEALLPCPFCGNTEYQKVIAIVELIDRELCRDISRFEHKFVVICSATIGGCGGSGPQASSPLTAETKWNRHRAGIATMPRIGDHVKY